MAFRLDPLYADLDYLTPLAPWRARDLRDFIAGTPDGGLVVDVGCGWAELLVEVLQANPTLRGLGVDLDEELLEHAAELAAERGVSSRLELVRGDGASEAPEQADALICMGASSIWAGRDAGVVDYATALGELRSRLPRNGRLVYGENICRDGVETARAQAALGGRPDEFRVIVDVLELAVEAGFVAQNFSETTLGEWDWYESAFQAGYARWLTTHEPDDPDAAAVRELAERHRRAYFGGYRGILSMTYLCLVAV